jgi:hypothetical protein
MKHITRIARKHSGYGFMVRYRGHSKWFADGKYGGENKALIAARFYLVDLKRANPAPKNKSGRPGIIKAFIRSGTKKLPCYIVQIKEAGVYRRFYPHHYGSDDEALMEAAAYRRQVERQLEQRATGLAGIDQGEGALR